MRYYFVGIRSVLLFLSVTAASVFASERPPNIIFILADDLGWAELGCYGNTFNETPHLDQLAAEGMRFTQAYAAAPVCSPYRAALLTGKHPARLGIVDYLRPNSANGISSDLTTLPEVLKESGYSTGMIGKWHLTGYDYHGAEYETRPEQHGFDWNIASEVKSVGNGANFWPYVFRDQPIRWLDIEDNKLGEEEYLTDRLNAEAIAFIERCKDRPFFLYLSHYATHSILNGRPDLVAKYRQKHKPGHSTRSKCYLCQDRGLEGDPLNHWAGDHNPHLAAMLESIDSGVGSIERKLAELGLAEDTIIVFTSDNGGETNVTANAPLRGGKSELYEGGIRVPLIVHWPTVVSKGSVNHQPTVNYDFYPTLLEAAGCDIPTGEEIDGVSTFESWKNADATLTREALYWHYPLDKPHFLGGLSAGAVREGQWKLIQFFEEGRVELYSIQDDPSEQIDVSLEQPATVAQLTAKLDRWRSRVSARRPAAPLLSEPRKLEFADHFISDRASSSWHFNSDWYVEEGELRRGDLGSSSSRIFLKDAKFRDSIIRFDFRLQESGDIRLVTGSNGHYNTVLHIHRDHFFLQTAKDATVPCFSYRHGECAFDFEPDKWYSMTIEFTKDKAVAQLDRDHIAVAQHPIIDRERTYFAFQVDQYPASFDNVQIFSSRPRRVKKADDVLAAAGKYPFEKPLDVELDIQKRNGHAWLHLHDENYRQLINVVEEIDRKRKSLYPSVFVSLKEQKKEISAARKRHNQENEIYKRLLQSTHRTKRAVDDWLYEQKPGSKDLPASRRVRELAKLHQEFSQHEEYYCPSSISSRRARSARKQSSFPVRR